MIKYRKMIVFFIIGVLLIGSGAIYTILSAMGTDVQEEVSDKTKTSVKKTQQDVSETYVNDSEFIDEKKNSETKSVCGIIQQYKVYNKRM